MKVKQILLSLPILFAALLFFSACGEKEPCCDNQSSDYSSGIFVVNEGPWGGTGTISWHNPDTGETSDSLFEKANNGAVLGQFVQSLNFHQGKAYIVVNGTNRVVIVDAASFRYLDTIGGLAQPRYFFPIDEHTAYVSQWGLDGLSGSVAKVDLHSNQVVKTIQTGLGPEKMIRVGDRVLVANSGGYGKDSTVTEIMLTNDQSQILSLPAGINPASLAWDEQSAPGKLFYLCKGYYLDTLELGRINYLGNNLPGIALPADADDLVKGDAGNLYFIAGNTLFKTEQSGSDFSISPVFSRDMYSMAFDADENLFYCADPNNFLGNGEIFVYRTDGTNIGHFRSGYAPGQIVIVK